MQKEFTYTKDKLRFILASVLEQDVMRAQGYRADERVEEGFEKRAALEFVLWFLEEAFPQEFSFACTYDELESEYGEHAARLITEGRGWSAPQVAPQGTDGNVVFVDFRNKP